MSHFATPGGQTPSPQKHPPPARLACLTCSQTLSPWERVARSSLLRIAVAHVSGVKPSPSGRGWRAAPGEGALPTPVNGLVAWDALGRWEGQMARRKTVRWADYSILGKVEVLLERLDLMETKALSLGLKYASRQECPLHPFKLWFDVSRGARANLAGRPPRASLYHTSPPARLRAGALGLHDLQPDPLPLGEGGA